MQVSRAATLDTALNATAITGSRLVVSGPFECPVCGWAWEQYGNIGEAKTAQIVPNGP